MSTSAEPFQFDPPRESSRVRGFLLNIGLPTTIAAVAASVITLASVWGEAPAGPDPESTGGRTIASAFETIHPKTADHRSSSNSQMPYGHLASLETDIFTGSAPSSGEWHAGPFAA